MNKQINGKIWLNFRLINETLNLKRRVSNIFYVSVLPYPALAITTITAYVPPVPPEGGNGLRNSTGLLTTPLPFSIEYAM